MQRNLTPNFTPDPSGRESLIFEDDSVRGDPARELRLVLRYPDGESEIVVLPLSLLAKLWPELTETITTQEEKLHAFGP
jgi:hypothetical protein